MKRITAIALLPLFLAATFAGCANPFAPELDPDLNPGSSLLGDPHTVEGVFQNVQYAYIYRDTLIYGQLLHPDFQFRYYNSERGTDVAFNRDEEIRITYNLFKGADQIDLQWNEIQSQEGDSLQVRVTRAYNLRITLQANDVFLVEGLATLRLIRDNVTDPWRILLWRDDSSF